MPDKPKPERCKACNKKINTMLFKGSGYCSALCAQKEK